MPLRGRDGEIASLDRQLERLRSGVGVALVVEGQAGLGKSALLAEAVTSARRTGLRCGLGVAEPADNMVQMAVLMEALLEGPEAVLGRDALPEMHASLEQRYWLLQDLEALLERIALDRPVLICLDDLQWADSGTAAALRLLPGRLASVPVGWVLAYRPRQLSAEMSRAVAELVGAGADVVTLGILDADEVADIVADVLGVPGDQALLDLVEAAHGNPFQLVELLRGLREEHLVTVGAGQATLVEARLPRRIRDSMRSRLERMPADVRQVAARPRWDADSPSVTWRLSSTPRPRACSNRSGC